MSSKIFKAIWTVAVIVFLASLVFLLGVSYNYFTGLQKAQLKSETELAAQGVSLARENYFEDLNTQGYRITWIGADGSVLYDNQADTSDMENHLEREEVKQALAQGYGESTRYSSTLSDKQLYAAKRLPDGSVLRLSIVQVAVWTLVLGFAQPICIVVLIALVLSFVLASRLAKRIVKPINEIDPQDPEHYYGDKDYKEIEPLLRHISEQQARLKADKDQIEKTALIRQEFTANVSHELKTPLHAISGCAELLENGMVQEADVKPFAGKIREEASRLTKLVEDIIELTRLDNGGAEMKWEECDILRIVENAADSLDSAADASGVNMTVEGESAPVLAVPQLIYSIAYNLLDNAVKYNLRGGTVSVKVKQNKLDTVLTVEDTGIGIPEECLNRIFERFYRVDKSRSKEVGGTGLGLSIVKHGVLVHNGRIEVTSEVGKGTKFVVTLPNRPKNAVHEEEPEYDII